MKLNSVLKSNHDLKKNGYKIIRKLHKIEKAKGANKAYSAAFEDTYYFVLSIKALVDIIKVEYTEAERFLSKCEEFLTYIDGVAEQKGKIDKTILASFLRAYTQFFNRIIDEKHKFVFTQDIVELWNLKCLMAYIAVWSKK